MENVSGGSQKKTLQGNGNQHELQLVLPTLTQSVQHGTNNTTPREMILRENRLEYNNNHLQSANPTSNSLRASNSSNIGTQKPTPNASIKEVQEADTFLGAIQKLCSAIQPQLPLQGVHQMQMVPFGPPVNPTQGTLTNSEMIRQNTNITSNTDSIRAQQTSVLAHTHEPVDEFEQFVKVATEIASIFQEKDEDPNYKDARLHVKGLANLRNASSSLSTSTLKHNDDSGYKDPRLHVKGLAELRNVSSSNTTKQPKKN